MAASQQYAHLTEIEKKELLKSDETKPKVMSKQQIKTSGKKIFKKIQKHVGYCDLFLLS